ncbi:MAG: triphosphoribosyl-dephospho-CoA synthase [Sulfolobales archaeon]
MRFDTILRKAIATSFSLGFALEALAPNKVSTVSYKKRIKDLTINHFINTVPLLYNLYISILEEKSTKPRIGFWINKIVSDVINDDSVGTNTCLGYAILTIPIIYATKYFDKTLNPVELAREASELVRLVASEENAEDFYRALRIANPSYANKYLGKVPDIRTENVSNYLLLDVLIESSYWDLIAYEVMHHYQLTLDAYNYMSSMLEGGQTNILDCISKAQYYLLSKHLDTEIVKGFGMIVASFTKSYQEIINLLGDNNEVQQKLLKVFDSYLRSNNINPGAVADILALATSLTLLNHAESTT